MCDPLQFWGGGRVLSPPHPSSQELQHPPRAPWMDNQTQNLEKRWLGDALLPLHNSQAGGQSGCPQRHQETAGSCPKGGLGWVYLYFYFT